MPTVCLDQNFCEFNPWTSRVRTAVLSEGDMLRLAVARVVVPHHERARLAHLPAPEGEAVVPPAEVREVAHGDAEPVALVPAPGALPACQPHAVDAEPRRALVLGCEREDRGVVGDRFLGR